MHDWSNSGAMCWKYVRLYLREFFNKLATAIDWFSNTKQIQAALYMVGINMRSRQLLALMVT